MNRTGKQHEEIKRNISNLFLASISVQDSKRSDAFSSLYSMMRIVDDLADSIAESDKDSSAEIERMKTIIDDWQESVIYCYEGDSQSSSIDLKVMHAIAKFQIPQKVWTWFFKGMQTPVTRQGFNSLEDLASYGQAAAIAPLAIFLITLFSEPTKQGIYNLDPDLKVLQASESLGLWSYMIHLLALEKTYLLSIKPARNLLPLNIMSRYKITGEDLLDMARQGSCNKNMRDMVRELLGWAVGTGSYGLGFAKKYIHRLPEDRRNALGILITVYSAISKRIRKREFDIFSEPQLWKSDDRTKLVSIIQNTDNFEDIAASW